MNNIIKDVIGYLYFLIGYLPMKDIIKDIIGYLYFLIGYLPMKDIIKDKIGYIVKRNFVPIFSILHQPL